MANQILSQHCLGDMEVTYLTNDHGQVGMMFLPISLAGKANYLNGNIESISSRMISP